MSGVEFLLLSSQPSTKIYILQIVTSRQLSVMNATSIVCDGRMATEPWYTRSLPALDFKLYVLESGYIFVFYNRKQATEFNFWCFVNIGVCFHIYKHLNIKSNPFSESSTKLTYFNIFLSQQMCFNQLCFSLHGQKSQTAMKMKYIKNNVYKEILFSKLF